MGISLTIVRSCMYHTRAQRHHCAHGKERRLNCSAITFQIVSQRDRASILHTVSAARSYFRVTKTLGLCVLQSNSNCCRRAARNLKQPREAVSHVVFRERAED